MRVLGVSDMVAHFQKACNEWSDGVPSSKRAPVEKRMVNSDSSSLPRVLIVNGEPAFAASGTSITLGSLFQGWPRERLAQVYTTALPHTPTGTIDYHVPA